MNWYFLNITHVKYTFNLNVSLGTGFRHKLNRLTLVIYDLFWETILKSLIRRSGWRSQTSISCYLCRSLVGRIWFKSQWGRPAVWQHNKEGIIPSMFFNFMVKADSVKVLDEKSGRHWKRRRIEAAGDPWIDSIRWRVQHFKKQ